MTDFNVEVKKQPDVVSAVNLNLQLTICEALPHLAWPPPASPVKLSVHTSNGLQ